MNAEAFIMTFSLNNYARDHTHFNVALQWETAFLEIVEEFQKNNTKFDFAYMSEVKSKFVGEIFCPPAPLFFFLSRLIIFPLFCAFPCLTAFTGG